MRWPRWRATCARMGGGAKAVQADTAGRFHQPIGAVAYQSRAEQRRRLQVVVVRRQLEAIAGIGDGELRKTAVNLVAGIAGAVAQVFLPCSQYQQCPQLPPSQGTPTR